MKIVYFASRFPLPETGGDKILTNQYLAALGSRHDVHFVSFAEHGNVEAEREAELRSRANLRSVTVLPFSLAKLWSAARGALRGWPLQVGYYFDQGAARAFADVVEAVDPDVVIIQTIRLFPFLKCAPRARKVVHFVDALSKNYHQSARSARGRVRRWLYSFEYRRLKSVEREALAVADLGCAVAPTDAEYLSGMLAQRRGAVAVMPVGVDGEHFRMRPLPQQPHFRIAFVGNMQSRANEDAVVWFAEEMLPEIRSRLGRDLEFVIVGQNPTRRVQQLASDGIRVLGRVPDLLPFLLESDLTVAPMRISTGIQNKILQSLALGRPVVATESCVTGMALDRLPALFTGAGAAEIVDRTVACYRDYARLQDLARQTSEYIHSTYAAQHTTRPFVSAVERLVEGEPALVRQG